MDYKRSYLKYKSKYINLKRDQYAQYAQYGGECNNQDEIKSKIGGIIADFNDKYPSNACSYAFLDKELMTKISDDVSKNGNLSRETENEYATFLKTNFPYAVTDKFFRSEIRKIVIKNLEENPYKKILDYASYLPHRDFDGSEASFCYNMLCYLSVKNCDMNTCGLGLIYYSKEDTIKHVELPVCEGLILCVRDAYFYHYTPKPTFIDSEHPVERILVRSFHAYGGHEESFFVTNNKQTQLNAYIETKFKDQVDMYNCAMNK